MDVSPTIPKPDINGSTPLITEANPTAKAILIGMFTGPVVADAASNAIAPNGSGAKKDRSITISSSGTRTFIYGRFNNIFNKPIVIPQPNPTATPWIRTICGIAP